MSSVIIPNRLLSTTITNSSSAPNLLFQLDKKKGYSETSQEDRHLNSVLLVHSDLVNPAVRQITSRCFILDPGDIDLRSWSYGARAAAIMQPNIGPQCLMDKLVTFRSYLDSSRLSNPSQRGKIIWHTLPTSTTFGMRSPQ